VLALDIATVDGASMLATGGIDGMVRLWDIDTATDLHDTADIAVASATQGHLDRRAVTITGHRNGVVHIWDTANGQHVRRLDGHTDVVAAVAFGRLRGALCVVSAGADGQLLCWNAETGEPYPDLTRLNTYMGQATPITSVTFLDGQKRTPCLAYLAGTGDTILIPTAWGAEERLRLRTDPPVHLLACGELFAATTANGDIDIVGTDNQPVAVIQEPGLTCAPASMQDTLATSGKAQTVNVWNVRTGDLIASVEKQMYPVTALAFGKVNARTMLAVAMDDGSLAVADPNTGARLAELPGHHGPIRALCFAMVGDIPVLVSCGDEGTQAISFPTWPKSRGPV
jgi:WD40 repeat protein